MPCWRTIWRNGFEKMRDRERCVLNVVFLFWWCTYLIVASSFLFAAAAFVDSVSFWRWLVGWRVTDDAWHIQILFLGVAAASSFSSAVAVRVTISEGGRTEARVSCCYITWRFRLRRRIFSPSSVQTFLSFFFLLPTWVSFNNEKYLREKKGGMETQSIWRGKKNKQTFFVSNHS